MAQAARQHSEFQTRMFDGQALFMKTLGSFFKSNTSIWPVKLLLLWMFAFWIEFVYSFVLFSSLVQEFSSSPYRPGWVLFWTLCASCRCEMKFLNKPLILFSYTRRCAFRDVNFCPWYWVNFNEIRWLGCPFRRVWFLSFEYRPGQDG